MRSTDDAFVEDVRRFLQPFRLTDADADVMQVYSADCGEERRLGERRIEGKLRLYLETLGIYEGRMREEMLGKLISDARDTGTAHSNEFVRVRAAGVRLSGTTMLFPSEPNAHLATLAALLVRGGAEYIGDEMVKIEPILRQLHASPLPLLVDTHDVTRIPGLGRAPRRGRAPLHFEPAATPRRPVLVDELGGVLAAPSTDDWIVFPVFSLGGPTELRPLGDAQALFSLTQATLNLNVWGPRALVLLREILASSEQVVQLVVGSLDEAVDLLASWTGGGG